MNMESRPATPQERLYAYPQSQQISMQTGYIGCMAAEMDVFDDEFEITWDDFNPNLKSDKFKAEFERITSTMGFNEQPGDQFRDAMEDYCHAHPESSFDEGYYTAYAFRLDTEQYTYLLRMKPALDEAALYIHCYTRKWFDRHMEQAQHGIRFITPNYKEKFQITDGDKIRITTRTGEYRELVVRYVDEVHMELVSPYSCNLYHICQFAEQFERNRCRELVPLRNSLPETCYSTLLESGMVVVLKKGETGYYKMETQFDNREDAEKMVNEYNAKLGVTKAQAEAMKGGSMFGFDKPVADPANYDKDGQPIRPRHRDRGDAR